jgi:hypothetical protein
MTQYGTRSDATVEDRIAAESVKQRVFLAVQDLCIEEGDVRARLIVSISTLMPLNPDEFPEALRKDFEWVMLQSTKHESTFPEHRSNLEVTMKKIRNSTGKKIAEKIFRIYSEIQNIRGFPLLGNRKPSE